ncbi:hypothetical protein SBY92_003626 [Candida maltosa Xu316]|uniref:Uncharacterized protein n=1 Tax=Candida maltosa (strain Xu316) TaxID=1245528 RepID=M3IUF5_CANMX|nr:hypothetical protein G210_4737 [Candida maltosa Xu316]
MSDDDELFNELDELDDSPKVNKVKFKKKPQQSTKTIQRTKLSFDEEEDDDDDGETPIIKTTSTTTNVLFRKKKLVKKSPSPEPIKKSINLSKYKPTEEPSSQLLELDHDDPENNPTIVNLDDISDDEIKQEIKQSNSEMFPPPPPPKKYVPIETNRHIHDDDENKTSIRQFANSLANEYKDDKNYDDGTEQQQDKIDFSDSNDDDGFVLSDSDMLRAETLIDFAEEFNEEIRSDEDDYYEGDGKLRYIDSSAIPTLEQQLENVKKLIEKTKADQQTRDELLKQLAIERELLEKQREEVVEMLNNLDLE